MILPDICLDTANIEVWMPMVFLEQFHNMQLAKISSTRLQLHYNVLISSKVKELQEDSICYAAIPPTSSEIQKDLICYDASPPNSSELHEDFICYDANPDSYISPNPESSIKYATTSSSSMQHKLS